MNVYKTAIDGIVIIEPRVFEDARGYFFESFSQREFDEKVTSQFSTFNFDFSLFNSPIGLQFFIPKGFAHGFAVLSETAVFQYKCDEFYHPEADGGISITDNSLGIDWRIPMDKAILSEKDTKHALLKDFDSPFDIESLSCV